jgi:hypothetical protein
MCKKKIKDIVANNTSKIKDIGDNTMNTSNINIQINKINDGDDSRKNNPPSPPSPSLLDNARSSKYLNNLISIIKKMIDLKCKSNVITMKNFKLDITLIEDIKDCDDNEIYDNLNIFFKEIYEKKISNLEKIIDNIIFTYIKIP